MRITNFDGWRSTILTLVACGVLVVAGCGKHGADDDAIADEYLSLWADWAVAIEASDGDCTRMASGLEAVVAKYDRDLPRLRTFGEQTWPEKLKDPAFVEKVTDRIKRTPLSGHALEKCIDDPRVRAVASKSGLS
jgi:hypothetical protein